MTAIDKFAPSPTPESQPFWDGLTEKKLLLPHCSACDRFFFPPMPGCPNCCADESHVSFREASGKGRVYSWVVAHYPFDTAFAQDVPYTVLTVDLEEGVRVNGRLLDAEPEDVREGLTVQADFEALESFTRLAFRASEEESGA